MEATTAFATSQVSTSMPDRSSRCPSRFTSTKVLAYYSTVVQQYLLTRTQVRILTAWQAELAENRDLLVQKYLLTTTKVQLLTAAWQAELAEKGQTDVC